MTTILTEKLTNQKTPIEDNGSSGKKLKLDTPQKNYYTTSQLFAVILNKPNNPAETNTKGDRPVNNEKLKQHAHQRLEDFKTHKKQQGQELAQTLEQELREYRAKLKYQAERSTQKNLEHIAKTITTSNKEARTRYLAALEKAETDHPLIKERREEMALKIYLGIIKTNQTLLDNLKREFGIE